MTEPEYRTAIAVVRPDLAAAPLTLHKGWDSVAVEAAGTIFKFPRHVDGAARLRKEAGLLALVRPRVPLAVPDMRLHEAPTLFSEHEMIPGTMIGGPQYQALAESQRRAMAESLADFYAALHAIPLSEAIAAGATPKPGWPPASDIVELARTTLSPALLAWVCDALAAYDGLDNSDLIFGYFDGHGWNMAFDHRRGVLNGLYDFADAGIGPRPREFGYSSLISSDLTERLVSAYQERTGREISLRDVTIRHAVQRLAEIDPASANRDWSVRSVVDWHDYMQGRADLRVG